MKYSHHVDLTAQNVVLTKHNSYVWRSPNASLCLVYKANDPYAVTAAIDVLEGPETFVFARTLLSHGMRAPHGEGHVRITPGHHPALVDFDVTITGGRLEFSLPQYGLVGFLMRSYEVVEPGAESRRINWADELQHITGGELR